MGGYNKFFLLERPPRPGYMWSSGRETKRQADTSRPDYMWVEDWQRISKNPKLKESTIRNWKQVLKPRVSLARQNRAIKSCVQHEDLEDYQEKSLKLHKQNLKSMLLR